MIANALPVDARAIVVERRALEWPDGLERELHALPKRCAFRNDRVSVFLAGLQPGEKLLLGPWAHAGLLVLTFGGLDIAVAKQEFHLQETDSMVILPGGRYGLHAPEIADFLLMNLTLPNAGVNRCLCHGTEGRLRMLAAAAQLFDSHADV